MLDVVIARLKSEVDAFSGRVETAADYAVLIRQNALPKNTPAAHVLPLGLQGAPSDVASGQYSQPYTETIGVLLTFRDNTPTGRRALKKMRTIIWDVVRAIAGWAPGDEVGVFQLVRGQILNVERGAITYQLDFAILNHLEISP